MALLKSGFTHATLISSPVGISRLTLNVAVNSKSLLRVRAQASEQGTTGPVPETVSDRILSQAAELLRTAGVNTADPRLSLALSVGTQAARKVEQGLQATIWEVARYSTGERREGRPTSWEEALMTVPDLETIPYKVIERYGDVEIRQVESYLVAETRMTAAGTGFDFVGSGQAFNTLASYLFGKAVLVLKLSGKDQLRLGLPLIFKNKSREAMEMTTPVVTQRSQGQAMEMTTPVITSRGTKRQGGVEMEMTTPVINTKGAGDGWTMAFVIPSEFTEDTIPIPEDGSVTIRRVPPKLAAATAFPGYVTDADVAHRERSLRESISRLSRYAVAPGAQAEVAQYNPPFTPPFLRRNEVLLEIVSVG